jgi:catechol 2,3-dioxygenase
VDPGAHIGLVELRVADLDRARRFYEDALGLEPIAEEPPSLGAGGRPLVVLREAEAGRPAPPRSTGLFHVAIRHPSRPALATALKRLLGRGGGLSGASDHGVSEALYLSDPDHNGIELYRDRPMDRWPLEPDGSVGMVTMPLDLRDLLGQAASDGAGPVEPGTDIGHVHLKVSDVERSVAFYRDELGLSLRQRMGDEAAFLAAGDYHHHVGINTWMSRGAGPPPPGSAGLERFTFEVPSLEAPVEMTDPDGIALRLAPAQ